MASIYDRMQGRCDGDEQGLSPEEVVSAIFIAGESVLTGLTQAQARAKLATALKLDATAQAEVLALGQAIYNGNAKLGVANGVAARTARADFVRMILNPWQRDYRDYDSNTNTIGPAKLGPPYDSVANIKAALGV